MSTFLKKVRMISLLSMAFCLSSCGGTPLGSWRQEVAVSGHGTLRYCLYTFNEDHTLDYLDHREYDYVGMPLAEDIGGGTWSQSGNQITTTITWMRYDGASEDTVLTTPDTVCWTISGDQMQSGGVTISRIS